MNCITKNGHLVVFSKDLPFKPMKNKNWIKSINKILKKEREILKYRQSESSNELSDNCYVLRFEMSDS